MNLTAGDRSMRGGDEPVRAQRNGGGGLARLGVVAGLQRGHRRGWSPSEPSIRVTWSHWPRHGGRARRGPRCGGSSPGKTRAVGSEYGLGLHTPAVSAPVSPACGCGIQPGPSLARTAGASLARWVAVSGQPSPRAAKNLPTTRRRLLSWRWRPVARAGAEAADGPWMVPWAVRVQPLHPVPAPVAPVGVLVAPRSRRGAPTAPRAGSYPQARRFRAWGAVGAPLV